MSLYRFFATFPSGFSGLVEEIMESDYRDASLESVLDNAVVYGAPTRNPRAAAGRYFQNTFLIIDRAVGERMNTLEDAGRYFTERVEHYALDRLLRPYRDFRVVFSDENKLVSVAGAVRERIERRISRAARARVENRRPATELWISRRSEGMVLFLLRLPTPSAQGGSGVKGMLSPQIGSLLCRLSEPDSQDVFVDPFCGNGGVFLERLRWRYRMAFALDKDPRCVLALKQRLGERRADWRRRTYVRVDDGVDLKSFDDGFVSKIVTDPPWGHYERDRSDIAELYQRIVGSCGRVLQTGGIAVLLVARDIDLKSILRLTRSTMSIEREYDVLVSGRKATTYKLRNRAA